METLPATVPLLCGLWMPLVVVLVVDVPPPPIGTMCIALSLSVARAKVV